MFLCFQLQAVTLIKKQNMAAQVPATLKGIQPYLKIAQEYDKRDAVVAYYCKFFLYFVAPVAREGAICQHGVPYGVNGYTGSPDRQTRPGIEPGHPQR